jgi:hypothetical protein
MQEERKKSKYKDPAAKKEKKRKTGLKNPFAVKRKRAAIVDIVEQTKMALARDSLDAPAVQSHLSAVPTGSAGSAPVADNPYFQKTRGRKTKKGGTGTDAIAERSGLAPIAEDGTNAAGARKKMKVQQKQEVVSSSDEDEPTPVADGKNEEARKSSRSFTMERTAMREQAEKDRKVPRPHVLSILS